jgi:hypothetical protein
MAAPHIGLILPGFSADDRDWCIPVTVDLVRRLAGERAVTVFALRYPAWAGTYTAHRARVIALGGGARRRLSRAELLARALVAILHVHRRQPLTVLHGLWLDEPGFLAGLAGTLLRIPTLASLMGGELVHLPAIGYGGQRSAAVRVLTALAVRLCRWLTAGWSGGLRMLRAVTPVRRHDHIQPLLFGVEPALFAPEGPAVALRGDPVKNVHATLAALARLRATGREACLHLLGDGPEQPAIAARAEAWGLREAVVFHQRVPRETMADYYRGATVLAVPSWHEGQVVVALEALLCGLPVVGSDRGLIADLAPAITSAVAPDDYTGLAAALAAVSTPAVRAQRAQAGLAYARAHGTVERTLSSCRWLYGL